MADQRTANLLGAFALAVGDAVIQEAQDVAYGASAPAAILRIGTYSGNPIESLRRALQLSHSATVRLIDRLEAEGLVRRERDPKGGDGDHRKVALYLTHKGEHHLNSILSRRYGLLQPLLDTLSQREQTELASIMEKLIARLTSPDRAAHICRLCDAETCLREGCPAGYYPPEASPARPE